MKNVNNVLRLLTGSALLLTGCSLAPKYARPEASVPARWPAHADTQPATRPADAALVPWRDFFTDPRLQKIIDSALRNNRDLRVAALNVERARALYGVQRSELLPTLDANAGMIRQRVPADLSYSGHATTASQYSVNLGSVAWEADLFGRIRNLSEQALQEFLAAEQNRRSVQMILISEVANAYLTLAADRESLQLAEGTLATQQGMYDLVKNRLDHGIIPEIDLYRAQTQVETARVDAARYTQLVALDQNALELLVGAPVSADLLPQDLNHLGSLAHISAGVSSDVLLDRPDILAAENHLRGAYANIGAARAAFFPRITLTAAAGTASGDLAGLFDADARTWNYAPQVVVPIFDPRTWNSLSVSKVDRDLAVAQYQRAIQNGFREVADALAIRSTVTRQFAAQQSLVNAVDATYRLATARYNRGLDSYLDVLDAQRSLYSAQNALIGVHLQQLANQIRLYVVLGGGWQDAPQTPATAPAASQAASNPATQPH